MYRSLYCVALGVTATNLLCAGPIALAQQPAAAAPEIAVRFEPIQDTYDFGGPLGVTLSIQNKGQEPVYCDFSPRLGLEFQPVSQQSDVQVFTFEPAISVRTPVSQIPAGIDKRFTVYLNRFLLFRKPGKYVVQYSLDLFVWRGGAAASPTSDMHLRTFTGTFSIGLQTADAKALERDLSTAAKGLTSPDFNARTDATEALRYLDIPLVIPYLGKMLKTADGNEAMAAVDALHRFNTPEATKLLESALAGRDSFVVEDAINALVARHVFLSRDQIVQLLRSIDDGIRWDGVIYLANYGKKSDEPLLRPLVHDPNPILAKKTVDTITHLLSNQK